MTNAADPRKVRDAAKAGRRTRIQELGDLEYLLQNQSGRRFYWRLMMWCGIFELSHTRGETHQTAFHEGTRNVGLKLLDDLMDAAPQRYIEMREENYEEADNGGSSGSGTGQDGGAPQDSIDDNP